MNPRRIVTSVLFVLSIVFVSFSVATAQEVICDFPSMSEIAAEKYPNAADEFRVITTFRQVERDSCSFVIGGIKVTTRVTGLPVINRTVLFWLQPDGRYEVSEPFDDQLPVGSLVITAREEQGVAAFYFAHYLPKTSFTRAQMDRKGQVKVKEVLQSQLPADVSEILTGNAICSLPNKFSMMERLVNMWGFTKDATYINQVSAFQAGIWTVYGTQCDVASAQVWLEGDLGPDAAAQDVHYTVTFFAIRGTDGKVIVSQPTMDLGDDIQYITSFGKASGGMVVNSFQISGQKHRYIVGFDGSLSWKDDFQWPTLFHNATNQDMLNDLDPAKLMPFTYAQVAATAPDPYIKDIMLLEKGSPAWFAATADAQFLFSDWKCLGKECPVMSMNILGATYGKDRLQDQFNWTVFAFLNKKGLWELSPFVQNMGLWNIFGQELESEQAGVYNVNLCFVQPIYDDPIVDTVQIDTVSGFMTYQHHENKECPPTAIFRDRPLISNPFLVK